MAKTNTVNSRNTFTSNAVMPNQKQTFEFLREVSRKAKEKGLEFPRTACLSVNVSSLDYIQYEPYGYAPYEYDYDGEMKAVMIPYTVDFTHTASKPTDTDKANYQALYDKKAQLDEMVNKGMMTREAYDMLWTLEDESNYKDLQKRITDGGKKVYMTCTTHDVLEFEELAKILCDIVCK